MKTKLYLIVLSWLMISNAAQAQFETVAQISTNGDANAIHFVNENLGYACGEEYGKGVMYKTLNGGKDWTKFYTSEQDLNWILDIFFIDENIGFALQQNGIYGKVLKTTNGGEDGTEYNLSGLRGNSIYFVTPEKGFIAGGAHGDELPDSGGTGVLYKTENGGETWETQYLPNLYDRVSYLNKVQFINSQLGFIAGDNSIFVTKNGGDSWTNVSDNYREWNPDENRYGFPFPDSFTGINESVWFTACSGGIRKTTDGGNTWQWATLPEIPANYRYSIRDVKFINTQIGIAVGGYAYAPDPFVDAHGVILKTIDGGNTWVKLSKEFETWGLDIHAVNDQILYSIGYGWTVDKTTNAGGELLGISENGEWVNQAKIYPNPANNIIYFSESIFQNQTALVKIFSLDGQLIETQTINLNQPKMDVNSLTNGVYLLDVKSGNNSLKQKIIIKK